LIAISTLDFFLLSLIDSEYRPVHFRGPLKEKEHNSYVSVIFFTSKRKLISTDIYLMNILDILIILQDID